MINSTEANSLARQIEAEINNLVKTLQQARYENAITPPLHQAATYLLDELRDKFDTRKLGRFTTFPIGEPEQHLDYGNTKMIYDYRGK